MNLHLDDQAKLHDVLNEYKDTSLAKDNNQYFQEKPYFKEHHNANQWSKTVAILGHILSIFIGCGCGYLIGFALFSGFDTVIWKAITVGSILGVLFILIITSVWELIKHKFLHTFFKKFYQFKRKYTGWKDWSKLAILFGGSLVLSSYGGFELVSKWFGQVQTTQTTMVDVDQKTKHITDAIRMKHAMIDTLEVGQQMYLKKGKLRRIKIDTRISGIHDDITALNNKLIEQTETWEGHNITAGGATALTNIRKKEDHQHSKMWYAGLFAFFALCADLVTLYAIRFNERYKYLSHLEIVGLQWFLNQEERKGMKMQVVHRRVDNPPTDPTSPDKTTKKPPQTTSGSQTSSDATTETSSDRSPEHGQMFWSDGCAYMWFKKSTDGSLVTKNAGALKSLRNKASSRSTTAKSDDARKNNKKKSEYYGQLYDNLIQFQNQKIKVV